MHGFEAILMATHAGMETGDFRATVSDWVTKAKDPRWNRCYTEFVYQPMLEVMQYLRANGFKIYIVTGGGQAFVRPCATSLRHSARARYRLGRQNELFVYQRGPRRTRKGPRAALLRRRGREARRHLFVSWTAAARGFWKFGRRSANARVYARQRGSNSDDARPARRRRARICVWPGARIT